MPRSNKDAWLSGDAGDLAEAVVEDVPVPGQSIRIRALSALFSNEASSEAYAMRQVGGQQVARVNTNELEVRKFAHGVIEPQFTVEEARTVSLKFGRVFHRVIREIDRISGLDQEAIEAAQARFPDQRTSPNGADVAEGGEGRGGRSDVRPRAGTGAGDERPPAA